MGPLTKTFEERFAEYLGVRHAFLVSNGTSALHLALKGIGVGPGDEVIVPSMTFVATANSILYCGAKPVFADIVDVSEPNISPDDVRDRVTPKTKAILPVHYGGYPAKMDEILEIAKENDLKIVEDAAHAPGAEYRGRKAGTLGDAGCFSFFSNKNMVTGEGGMLVTQDDELGEKFKLMRSHGMTTLTWDRERGHAHAYDVVDLGYNYRSNEISAALGSVQLRKLEENNSRRERLAKLYFEGLDELDKISIPFKSWSEGRPSYHIFPIILSNDVDRKAFIENLKKKGIQTSIHYPPIHMFSHYRNLFPDITLPKSEQYGSHEVTLPLYPTMNNSNVDLVIEEITASF